MSTPKFEVGDDVQMVNRRREVVVDSAIVIDVVRLPMPLTKDPNIVVKDEIHGYILCPHPGPENACVQERSLRKRPIPGISWDAIKIYCEWSLKG